MAERDFSMRGKSGELPENKRIAHRRLMTGDWVSRGKRGKKRRAMSGELPESAQLPTADS